MTTVIKHCRGETKSRTRSQIKNRKHICEKKILEEYSVQIYKIDSYFCEHYKEKIQVDKNGCKYIFCGIHVYFTEYLFAVEIDKKKFCQRPYF